jgi:hypothetical protein
MQSSLQVLVSVQQSQSSVDQFRLLGAPPTWITVVVDVTAMSGKTGDSGFYYYYYFGVIRFEQ